MNDFAQVPAGYGERWLHESGRAWVQRYPDTNVRRSYWQAYVAVGAVPAGRDPQSVDNRRLGNSDHGFATRDEAMAAAAGSCA